VLLYASRGRLDELTFRVAAEQRVKLRPVDTGDQSIVAGGRPNHNVRRLLAHLPDHQLDEAAQATLQLAQNAIAAQPRRALRRSLAACFSS
jgi:hypothetical protein